MPTRGPRARSPTLTAGVSRPRRSASASSASTSRRTRCPRCRCRARPTTSSTRARWRASTTSASGGDYDGNDDWPEGLEDVAAYPRLFAELVRRGWSDADLEKLAQGNILRVLGAGRGRGRSGCARSGPPSTATLEPKDGARP